MDDKTNNKTNVPYLALFVLLGVLMLIWMPVYFGFYNLLTAVMITVGVILAGIVSDLFLKNKIN